MAANADIEDIFLTDLPGICRFLGLETPKPEKIIGKKGKSKIKRLFKIAGTTYHEGTKAKNLIDALNMEYIIENAPVKLKEIQQILL